MYAYMGSATSIPNVWETLHDPDSPSAFPTGGSKVIRGINAWKEGEPGNEATLYHVPPVPPRWRTQED